MKKSISLLFVLFTLPLFADITFHDVAHQVLNDTWNELYRCGLQRIDAYDPRLPRPQVPAIDAVVNSKWIVLAYTNEEFGSGATYYAFKNPNGGLPHSVTYGRDRIEFTTPYAGVIASASRAMTVGGPIYTYRCANQYMDPNNWAACVRNYYTMVIANQLCRYPLN